MTTATNSTKTRFSFKKIILSIIALLMMCIIAIIILLSTEWGNRFIFNRILQEQSMMSYEYKGGNIWTGVQLDNFSLKTEKNEFQVDTAKLRLGWRSLLFSKQLHLFQADLNTFRMIQIAPSDDTPFDYADIQLPITLRFNQATAKEVEIRTMTSSTKLHDIQLNDVVWKGTHLSFKDSKLNLYGVFIDNATGFIDFKQQGKYPLKLNADVDIPAIHSINIHKINTSIEGSLARMNGGVATYTPDLLTGWIVLNVMDDGVPMRGELQFKDYHLPFLTDEKLLAKNGVARFDGNANGFDIELDTDLQGKNTPQGQYTAKMHTDFVNNLNIHNLVGETMDGQVQLSGVVDWQNSNDVQWKAEGVFDRLKIPNHLLDASLQGFLPKTLTGQLQSQGSLKDGVKTQNQIQFGDEQWTVNYHQAENKKIIPVLNVAWRNVNREMPYITGLNSPHGQAHIILDKSQTIDVQADLKPFTGSFLPEGQYQTRLIIKDNVLNIPQFDYRLGEARLNAMVQVLLPSKKQPLNWDAKIQADKFNPQLVNENIPLHQLTGHVDVNGYAKNDTTQIIQTKNMNLTGQLANQLRSDIADTVKLTGYSTVAMLFQPAKQGGAFKSYAVQYDGQLTALNQTANAVGGELQLKMAGTPTYIDIQNLYHNGVAGRLHTQGQLDLTQGTKWDFKTALVHFKPQYVYAKANGDISGIIETRGEWSERSKKIDVKQFNIAGTFNNQPLRGIGQLSADLSQLDKGLKYQQFNANQLNIDYANNQLQISGNQNNLLMKIKAPALYAIHSDLKGTIYGDLTLSRDKRLQLTSNLAIDKLAYGSLFSVNKVKLQGELPISDQTPSQLLLTVQQLSTAGRHIDQATVNLTGTYLSHVLKIDSQQARSKFYVQLAGGIKNNQWLGQIQQGLFQSPRMKLEQNQNADIVYALDSKKLKIAKHCWNNGNNKLCFDEDITASPEQANISIMTKNIYIQDLDAFIPDDMQITGQLNGYAKASWKKGQTPQLDAQLFTKNGVIGLIGEQPDESTVLAYDDLSIIAKTTDQGIAVRTNMKTPSIGSGYANVLIKPDVKDMPMTGEIAFEQVDLQVLRPFIDDVRQMSGGLSIAGKIDGTLTDPQFYGDIRLKNGVFSLNSLPVDLSNIELYMAIRRNIATITGMLNSGKGVATLTGQAGWGQQPYLRLKMKGDNLLIRQAPQIMAAANTDMNLEILPLKKRINVDGKIHIPRALIQMPQSSATAVEVSSDVRIVRSDQKVKTLAQAKAWDINANIALSLGEQIIFQGFDANIPLTGKLDLTQRGTQLAMRATGAIGSTRQVQISAYGQTLTLSRAIARFNGGLLNPSLDINATKNIQGSTVGVRVLGTALTPSVQIYSNSGLSEQQALNALLTGSVSDGASNSTTTESFKSDVNNAIAAAGLSMGLGGTRALTNQIGRAFGLSGLALDAQGSGDDTQVSLTGYITPDLYIRYGVGVFSTVNKLSLRYQINKRLYLEASQDSKRAIDLFYNWRF